ncbi:MAG: aminotransferase class I/II-fold pyridoxal phosphate-dependent enzyme, partial [Acidimicrobiia bacterium]|nr:aminotransferase class I/II-fold pyridoxal phosphate-dependent enzyme [Acidimicrobiia bacterium]
RLGVDSDQLMFGGGSSDLLRVASLAVGGEGTSAVYPWPSFIVYRIGSALAGSAAIEVPLTADYHLDLDAMAKAVRDDTTLVFVCNPNNPTGTYRSKKDVAAFIDSVPERILVVVDEAYFEYATARDFGSAFDLALSRPNVVVLRTFSKIYSLASLRIGYAIGQASTLADLRRAQAPFAVNGLAQVAALTAIRFPERVEERVRFNESERERMQKELEARGVEYVPSQANFVYLHPSTAGTPATSRSPFDSFLSMGIIVREFRGGWIRVTVGSVDETDRFLLALDSLRKG